MEATMLFDIHSRFERIDAVPLVDPRGVALGHHLPPHPTRQLLPLPFRQLLYDIKLKMNN